jgi:hypothetical protein
VNFARVLKEVLWCLVTEGSISYRRIKRGFDLDDDALEDVRREMISTLRIEADIDGELLVWAPDGRAGRPEPMALPLAEYQGSIYENQRASDRWFFATAPLAAE